MDRARHQREVHPVEDLGFAFVGAGGHREIANVEQRSDRVWRHRERLNRGSTRSRIPSPKRLNPSTVTRMPRPGNVTAHQDCGKYSRPSAMASPQSGFGGVAPTPRKPRTAVVMIVKPIPMVARTITAEATLGKTCTNRMREVDAPRHRCASMKSAFRSRRTSL